MTFLPRAPRALLRFDAITVRRSTGSTIDSEGDPTLARTLVLEGRGTLAAVSAAEQLVATQRGTNVDKALLLEKGLDIVEGDWVTVGGTLYEAVAAEDRRLHRRLLLRKLN